MSGEDPVDPKLFNAAKSYLENSVKPYIAKYSVYKQFKNIQSSALIKELEAFVRNPSTLKEKKEARMVCGLYAFSYIYGVMEPSKFIQNVSDMYISGKMNTNGWETSVTNDLANKADISGTQSLPVYLFAGAIRERENNFVFAGASSGKYWGSTSHGTMKHWLQDMLGATVKEFSYGHEYFGAGVTKKDLLKLQKHLNDGKMAMLLVSAEGYNQLTDGKKIRMGSQQGKLTGGDHWIVLNGEMKINKDKNTVTFTAFDVHKGNSTITSSISDFQSMTNHVMMVEKKKK